ncbi:hypothetical protein B6D60_05095 [candidate division KSB1 bacterium 4484_87]|nr:MAG: hypothetical protein B6D60_05095 [candidate division KSB1 bacterium 4484_87]
MKLSVIIVTFNHADEIGKCLQSLKASPVRSDMEILLIDNNSADKTVAVASSFASDFEKFELIQNNENLGFTQGVNQGLKLASGDFVLLLNPDTIIPRETLPRLMSQLENSPQIGAISPQFRNPDGSIQPSCRRFPRRRDVIYNALGLSLLFPHSREFNYWKMGDFDHNQTREVEQPQGAFLLLRREVSSQIGFLDERFPMFFSDVDLCRRIFGAGWKILFFPEVHIIHAKGTSVLRNRVKMLKTSHLSFYHYFQKYYSGKINRLLNYALGIFLLLLMTIRIIFHYFRLNKR